MGFQPVRIEGEFVPLDIVRAATFTAGPDDDVIPHWRTLEGQFRGWMWMDAVHPGLIGSACDMMAVSDTVIDQAVERSVMVSLLLEGENGTFQPDGYDAITNRLERPQLVRFGEPRRCARSLARGNHCVRVGLIVLPAFVEHHAATMAEDDADLLGALLEPAFQSCCLARSDAMVRLAKALVAAPYQGTLGRLYRETLIAQMLFETLAHLRADRRVLPGGAPLPRKHRDAIRRARELIDASLLSPPGTIELAQAVGVNRNILQAGFRSLLGTTVFGYVRERRLTMARLLLEEEGAGAAEAGYRVGFASPSAFAAAYKRRFGLPPTGRKPG
jgi:AraC-like DNA-binding protein